VIAFRDRCVAGRRRRSVRPSRRSLGSAFDLPTGSVVYRPGERPFTGLVARIAVSRRVIEVVSL
jgi:hypothetical protein